MLSVNLTFLKRLQDAYNAPERFQTVDDALEWFRQDPWKTDLKMFNSIIMSGEYLFFKYVAFDGFHDRPLKIFHVTDFPTRGEQLAFAESVCFYDYQAVLKVDEATVIDNNWVKSHSALLATEDIIWEIPDQVWDRVTDDLWKEAHHLRGLKNLLIESKKVPYKEARDAILLWDNPEFAFKNPRLREKILVKLFKEEVGLKVVYNFLVRHAASEVEQKKWLTRYLDEWLLQTLFNTKQGEWFSLVRGDWTLECAVWFVQHYGAVKTEPLAHLDYIHVERLQKLKMYIDNGVVDVTSYCHYDPESDMLLNPKAVIQQFMKDYQLLEQDVTTVLNESPLLF